MFMAARIVQYAPIRMAKMMPGMNPARNSLPIDCSITIPQIISRTLGGISMPRLALPAIEPSANDRS